MVIRRVLVVVGSTAALAIALSACAPRTASVVTSPEQQLAVVGLRTTEAIGRVRVTLRTGYDLALYASDPATNRARYRAALQALERVTAANQRVAAGLAAYESAQVALISTSDAAVQVQSALAALDDGMRALGVTLQGTGVASQVAALTVEITRLMDAIRELAAHPPPAGGT